jgi:hypothetical protein
MKGLDDIQRARALINAHGEGNAAWDGIISRQDKPPPHPFPFCIVLCRVMQDKGNAIFLAWICTTPPTPPGTGQHNMYFIYIFIWYYIVYMFRYLLS